MTRNQLRFVHACAATLFIATSACGVRGRPQPPGQPPEIGRGQPNYKGATQDMAFPDVPSPGAKPSPTPPNTRRTPNSESQ